MGKMNKKQKVKDEIKWDPKDVIEVISQLLGPNGCPWDKKQTPDSLCEYLIEEVFELVEAIRNKKREEIEEELGDVFFLLFFISYLLETKEDISLATVFQKNSQKMKNRHPHVFGSKKISTEKELFKMWEDTKKKEKNHREKDPMDSVPSSLPPLLRAYRIHAKAAQARFTWDTDKDQEKSVLQEIKEWIEAKSKDQTKMEEEFGDILFSLVEYGRRHKIKANAALQKSINKFLNRYYKMKELAQNKGLCFKKLNQREKDLLWEEVKGT